MRKTIKAIFIIIFVDVNDFVDVPVEGQRCMSTNALTIWCDISYITFVDLSVSGPIATEI